jgi:hypothetical protein
MDVSLFATSCLESQDIHTLLDLVALNVSLGRFCCILFTALAFDMKEKEHKSTNA